MPTPVITQNDWIPLREEARTRAQLTLKQKYKGCRHSPPHTTFGPRFIDWPDAFPLIPEEQWKDRIKSANSTFLASMRKGRLPPHDQRRTSRCWAHGTVRALEVNRIFHGLNPVLLSPDSVAYPIEGTNDRGGFPSAACDQLAKGGACPQADWPEGDLSPYHAHPDWEFRALDYSLQTWIHVTTWQQQITAALRSLPVAIGLRWWGHLVCQLDPVILPDQTVGIGIDNSWGADWGDNGYAHVDRQSGTADLGAYALVTPTFSQEPWGP